jgi:hypothetical protein
MTEGGITGASVGPVEAVPHQQGVVVPDLPQVLIDMIADLEHWAGRNSQDAKNDAVKLWALKLPAIIISASSGLLAHLRFDVGVVAGFVVSVCVLLDGLLRAGALRTVHLRAVSDLKTLKHEIIARWRAGSLRGENLNELAATIVEHADKERRKIAAYLKAEEISSHSPHGRPA